MSEWQKVPAEPTREMLEAAWVATRDAAADSRMSVLLADSRTAHKVKMLRRWRAMLKASPDPPESEWQPIETAPRDKHILLFGTMESTEMLRFACKPIVTSGYWDTVDEAWCSTASTWAGPFVKPTHWMPLPEPPIG